MSSGFGSFFTIVPRRAGAHARGDEEECNDGRGFVCDTSAGVMIVIVDCS